MTKRSRSLVRFAAGVLMPMVMVLDGIAHAQGEDRAFGEYLASECVTCHQLAGQYQGIPSIVGWPDARFIEAMGEYRVKRRANAIMQTIAGRLSPEETAALAAYFGGLQPRP